MNNSVENQVIYTIFGTQNAEEILQLEDVTTIYLVKGKSFASDQISIGFFKNWMLFKQPIATAPAKWNFR